MKDSPWQNAHLRITLNEYTKFHKFISIGFRDMVRKQLTAKSVILAICFHGNDRKNENEEFSIAKGTSANHA